MKFMLCFSTMFNITPITGKHYIQGPLQVQNQLKIRIIVDGWSYFDAYSMLFSNIGAIIHLFPGYMLDWQLKNDGCSVCLVDTLQ